MTSNLKNIALATLAASTLATNAQDALSTRVRVEGTEAQVESADLFKTTLGLSTTKEGEFFRAYNYQGNNIDYTALGAKINHLNIGNLTNNLTLFGTSGTRDGAGIKTMSSFNNFSLELDAEQDSTSLGDSSRLGLGLDYHLGNVTLLTGFDRVQTPKDTLNNTMIGVYSDITKNDQIGVGFKRSEGKNDAVNIVGAYYMHWGKDSNWGTRSAAMYSWNEKTDNQKIKWAFIGVTGTPTLIHDAGFLPISRMTSYWFDSGVTENTVDSIERTYVGKRTKGGLAIASDGTINQNSGNISGNIKNVVAYTFPLGSATVSPGVYNKYDFTPKADTHTAGITALVKAPITKALSLEAEASAGTVIAGKSPQRSSELYGSLQLNYRF